jgi:uncharacterized membrane protein
MLAGCVVAALFWEKNMEGLVWIAVTIAFFALAIGYVHFCDRVK